MLWEQLPQRPEVQALQRDLLRFAALTEPRLVIDLHAPGTALPTSTCSLPRAAPGPPAAGRHALCGTDGRTLPRALNLAGLSRPTRYPSRWNALSTLGSWLWDYLERTPEVTIETSYQSLAGRPLDPDGYRAIGRRVALTAWAWLRERPQA